MNSERLLFGISNKKEEKHNEKETKAPRKPRTLEEMKREQKKEIIPIEYRIDRKEVIQHELEHIYQEFRIQKTIPNNMFYAKMRKDMESADKNRQKIKNINERIKELSK